jgi:hypothetical protein|tara:strand:- start:778 stop:996 length:219 start_codon:yes stop_codon:yes gene_type:complete
MLEVQGVAVGHQDLQHQREVEAQEVAVQVDKVELALQTEQQVQLTLAVVVEVVVVKMLDQVILEQVEQVDQV